MREAAATALEMAAVHSRADLLPNKVLPMATTREDLPMLLAGLDKDLTELVGGAQILAGRAREKLNGGEPLQALHLLDVALGAEPSNPDALAVKKDALQRLLTESGGANLSETMWLKSELAAADAALAQGA